jgi:hypothetical protein
MDHSTRGERVKDSAIGTGVGVGAGMGFQAMTNKNPALKKWFLKKGLPLGILGGAALGGLGQLVGDVVTDDPESVSGQAGSGAVGGALIGAPLAVAAAGKLPGGMNLAKFLARKRAIGQNRAAAEILGLSGLAGGAFGGLNQALVQAQHEASRERQQKKEQ